MQSNDSHAESNQVVNPEQEQNNALKEAVLTGDIVRLQELLANGAKPNAQYRKGKKLIMFAVQGNHLDTVSLLIEKGATLNVCDRKQISVLMYAIQAGASKELVSLLLDKGADPCALSKDESFALLEAVKVNRIDLVSLLVDRETPEHKSKAFQVATKAGYAEIATFLRDKGVKIVDSKLINFLLVEAVRKGYLPVVQLLLEEGADVLALDRIDNTPISYAAYNGDVPLIELLLKHGADINSRGTANDWFYYYFDNGHFLSSPLMYAVFLYKKRFQQTPLMLASKQGHSEAVAFLLAHGADTSLTDFEGKSALQLAIENERTEVIKLLEQKK